MLVQIYILTHILANQRIFLDDSNRYQHQYIYKMLCIWGLLNPKHQFELLLSYALENRACNFNNFNL